MAKKELIHQIGVLIGKGLVHRLPTLSTDMLRTNNVIEVGPELTEEWERRDRGWDNDTSDRDLFYENLAWYKENIEKKYLPMELELISYDIMVEIKDKEELIKGIEFALWDCDLSHYKVEDVVRRPYGTNTVTVKLKYDVG